MPKLQASLRPAEPTLQTTLCPERPRPLRPLLDLLDPDRSPPPGDLGPRESGDRLHCPNAVLRRPHSCESPRGKHRAPEPPFPKIRLLFGRAPHAPLGIRVKQATMSPPECPARPDRTAGRIRLE